MSDLFDDPFEEDPEPLELEPPAPAARTILSVTDLNLQIRKRLEREFFAVWVEGEISNCRLWNGHLFFKLKDKRSQIPAVLFRDTLRYLRFKPADGQRVVARGKVSLYEVKGEYQLVCEHLEPQGLGALQLALEQLKARLKAEGLFDAARKRPLPALPRRIGIVTSLDGAAIRDMLKVLGRRHRNARIVIKPARVQGDGAGSSVARAIRMLARVSDVDVIIVGRGGGSIEDLWAFNEEVVARAIATCRVPVISAVGHETDFTIADFAADHRAPTPSAAAEIVVAAEEEFRARIRRLEERLRGAVHGRVQRLGRRVHVADSRPAFAGFPARLALSARDIGDLTHALTRAAHDGLGRRARRLVQLRRQLDTHDFGRRLAAVRTRLVTADNRLSGAVERRRHAATLRLRESAGRLSMLSPLAVLGRGYAVTWNADRTRILRNAADVVVGESVHVTLAAGELTCDVRQKKT